LETITDKAVGNCHIKIFYFAYVIVIEMMAYDKRSSNKRCLENDAIKNFFSQEEVMR
jgi:hypothetical protein